MTPGCKSAGKDNNTHKKRIKQNIGKGKVRVLFLTKKKFLFLSYL